MSEESSGEDTPRETAVPKAEYEKAVQRAQNFEAQMVDLKKQLEGYSDVDPVKYRAVLEDYENLKRDAAAGDREEVDRLISAKESELEDRYQGAFSEKDGKIQTLESELKELRVMNTAKDADVFVAEGFELLRPIIDQHTEWKDGRIVVKDADGNVRHSTSNPGQEMPFTEYLKELAGKYPQIVKPDFKGGTKPPGETRNGTTTSSSDNLTPKAYAAMPEEQRKEYLSKNPGAWKVAAQALDQGLIQRSN